jgi:hypothetical protein
MLQSTQLSTTFCCKVWRPKHHQLYPDPSDPSSPDASLTEASLCNSRRKLHNETEGAGREEGVQGSVPWNLETIDGSAEEREAEG